MRIIFTKHAQEKFALLKRHRFLVLESQVIDAVTEPDIIDSFSRSPLLIAQKQIDDKHVLRVIYKQEGQAVKIITFYPGRVTQYEKKSRKN